MQALPLVAAVAIGLLLLKQRAAAAANGGGGPAAPSRPPLPPINKLTPAPAPLPASAEQRAAQLLAVHLAQPGANFGSAGNVNVFVGTFQTAMGGLVADGIVGPSTRARAKALGVELPMRKEPAQPAAAKPAPKPAVAAKPAAKPALVKPSTTATTPSGTALTASVMPARQAAELLRAHLAEPGANWGYAGHENKFVATSQRDMGLVPDGIVGPATRARALELGVTLPPRMLVLTPVSEPKALAAPAEKLPAAAAKTKVAAAPKAAAAPKPKPKAAAAKPASKTVQSTVPKPPPKPVLTERVASPAAPDGARAPAQAAKDLAALLKKPGANFGSKGSTDERVASCQRDMGGITADGIVGPGTRARAKALGVTLPARIK